MPHFSTEAHNNEQVWIVFRQNFGWNMPKNGLFWLSIANNRKALGIRLQTTLSPAAGGFATRPSFRLN